MEKKKLFYAIFYIWVQWKTKRLNLGNVKIEFRGRGMVKWIQLIFVE